MSHQFDPPRASPVVTLPPPRGHDLVEIHPFDAPLLDPIISERRCTELTEVLDADRTGVASLTLDGVVRTANDTFLDLVGARTVAEIVPGTASFGVLRSLLDHLPNELLSGDQSGVWQGDFDHHVLSSNGSSASAGVSERILRATVSVVSPGVEAPDGRLSLLVHDVTVERAEANKVHHEATHDPLTNLANRHHMLTHLAREIGEHRRRDDHVAVVFIDLDHLKYVNDAFGHHAGDQLLSSTATRLSHAVRPGDRVARIGGDEFVVIGTRIADETTAMELAERIRRALSGRLRVGELDLEFSVSIGVAITDEHVLQLSDDEAAPVLVADADTAMYTSKQGGRDRCTLFTAQMRNDARERAEVATTLARAVIDEALTVEYQPVYSLVTGRPVGAEALVRWFHPRLGRMDPNTFVGVAEESGTIGRLGEQVLAQALDDLVRWRSAGAVDDQFVMHVNISRVQLASSRFVDDVVTMLRDRKLRPSQLVLEARETSLLGRIRDVDRAIRSLRRVGVQIAVDDFGSGPKALSVMTDVGADVLKLDGALALPPGSSDVDSRLVRAVVLLAHSMNMDVVAERVGSPGQLQRLRSAGCDRAQGNLLAPPTTGQRLDLTTPLSW